MITMRWKTTYETADMTGGVTELIVVKFSDVQDPNRWPVPSVEMECFCETCSPTCIHRAHLRDMTELRLKARKDAFERRVKMSRPESFFYRAPKICRPRSLLKKPS